VLFSEPNSVAAECKIVVTADVTHKHLMQILRRKIGTRAFRMLDPNQFIVTEVRDERGDVVFGLAFRDD
jgi:hypothetical protein